MQIYIANRCWDYEGSYIVGVFTTQEAAQQYCDADKAESPYVDYWVVEEYTLQGAEDADHCRS